MGSLRWRERGYDKKYGGTRPVWYEARESIESARQRELRMKEWKRGWKLREIGGVDPDRDDLHDRLPLP